MNVSPERHKEILEIIRAEREHPTQEVRRLGEILADPTAPNWSERAEKILSLSRSIDSLTRIEDYLLSSTFTKNPLRGLARLVETGDVLPKDLALLIELLAENE